MLQSRMAAMGIITAAIRLLEADCLHHEMPWLSVYPPPEQVYHSGLPLAQEPLGSSGQQPDRWQALQAESGSATP